MYGLILTESCNMSCKYCFEKHKNYGRQMNDEIIISAADYIVKDYINKGKEDYFVVNITGGEPFLKFDLLKKLLLEIKEKMSINKIKQYSFEISTNGTIINEGIIKFIIKNNIRLFVGFDGIKKSYNEGRFFKDQPGVYNIVYKNILILKEKVNKNNIVLNLVITPENVQYLNQNINFMYILDLQMSITFAYEQEWSEKSIVILRKEFLIFLNFYKDIVKTNHDFSIGLIDKTIKQCLFPRNYYPGICSAAEPQLVILTDGNIVPCGSFCYIQDNNTDFIIGNVFQGIDENKRLKFRKSLENIDFEECKGCLFINKCTNYCTAINYLVTNNTQEIPSSVCEINKILITGCELLIDNLTKENSNYIKEKYLKEVD